MVHADDPSKLSPKCRTGIPENASENHEIALKHRFRRLRPAFPFLAACFGVLLVIAAYVFGLAWFQSRSHRFFSPSDLFLPRLIDVTVAVWCFWIGSSIGSFLNVVAWRLPRGETINGRSHCPRCQTTLRAWDNFPVFGWLRLAGRCRTCRLPISARYPIVELTIGFCVMLVALGQLYRFSVPGLAMPGRHGPLWAPMISFDVLAVLLFHVYALATAWAFALVRIDNNRLPANLVAWGLLPIMVAMLVFPWLGIVSWRSVPSPTLDPADMTSSLRGFSVYVDAILRVLTATVAASILGRSLARGLCPAADPKLDPLGKSTAELMDLIAILAVPSLLLGWQSAIGVVVVSSIVAAVLNRTILVKRKMPQRKMLGCFAIATCLVLTLHLMFWPALIAFDYWPTPRSEPMVVLFWAGLILLTPFWLKKNESSSLAQRPQP